MTTLYLHASSKKSTKTSLQTMVHNGCGPSYALTKKQVEDLDNYHPIRVVIIDNVAESRAEGTYHSYRQNGKTDHCPPRPRFDVMINNLTIVDWTPLNHDFNRNGTLFDVNDTLNTYYSAD